MKITIDLTDLEISVLKTTKDWFDLQGDKRPIAYTIACKMLKAVANKRKKKK